MHQLTRVSHNVDSYFLKFPHTEKLPSHLQAQAFFCSVYGSSTLPPNLNLWAHHIHGQVHTFRNTSLSSSTSPTLSMARKPKKKIFISPLDTGSSALDFLSFCLSLRGRVIRWCKEDLPCLHSTQTPCCFRGTQASLSSCLSCYKLFVGLLCCFCLASPVIWNIC